ncbi:MAG TPA: DUF6600 domain-containing protein [Alphaproteobacteria bacterium]
MRKLLAALVPALIATGAMNLGPAATPASAQSAVSISLFYQQLAPHGRWFQHPRWGWAWFPLGVGADWRPYSRGNWVWTDEYGWYWVSDEPFGWATYHYGRWTYDEAYGWVWIPGGTWGPAWVAFRYGDDEIGWAPLPPETIGASYDWDAAYTDLTASYYVPRWLFVPRRHFLSHRVYAYAAASSRNGDFIGRTRNVTRYERGRRGVFNRSLEPRRLEAALGRRIVAARINTVSNPRRVGPDRSNRAVNVFRPEVRMTRDAAPPNSARALPRDRPRAAIRRDEVAPSDRRDSRRITPQPGPSPTARPPYAPRPPASSQITPRSQQPGARREHDLRRAAPESMPPANAVPPGVAQPRTPLPGDHRGRDERAAPPGPSRTVTRPAAPRPPAAAAPPAPQRSVPPSFAHPPQPPRVAPSAPPQHRAPPAPPPRVQPPAPRPQPHAAPPPRQAPPQRQAPAKSASPLKKQEEPKGSGSR